MLYFQLNADGSVAKVLDHYRDAGPAKFESRHDWKTFADAAIIAISATIATGEQYIATDAGPGCYPRFDVVRMYEIGDEVSMSFNGDVYPIGKIIRISKTLRKITTKADNKYGRTREFYRVGQSGSWRFEGTWFLCRGNIYKQNPNF